MWGSAYPGVVHRWGKCHPCRVIYRWEDSDGLKLADARCGECGAPLKRTRGNLSSQVQDVDAAWLRELPVPDGGKDSQ